MAELTIVGSNACAPDATGAAAGYILSGAAGSILIDCGPGAVYEMASLGLLDNLDAVLVSHQHYDHIGDLMTLAFRRSFPEVAEGRLPVFGPAEVLDVCQAMDDLFGISTIESLSSPTRQRFDFHSLQPNSRTSVVCQDVTVCAARHAVPAFSYRFCEDALTYTGDTALTEDLIELARESVILGEATYPSSRGRDLNTHGHMSGIELGELARRADARGLIVTHMADAGDRDETVANVKENYEGPVIVAEPRSTIDLSMFRRAA